MLILARTVNIFACFFRIYILVSLQCSCNILSKSQSVQVCKHVLLKLSESLYLHFLVNYFTFLSSILNEHCKFYFTITLMSPDKIWPDIMWADKICI